MPPGEYREDNVYVKGDNNMRISIFIIAPFIFLFAIMLYLCLSFKVDEGRELPAAGVMSKNDESLSEPAKYEPSEATGTVNLKYHLNSVSIEPGIDLNKNLRMNIMSGDIEFGTTLGDRLWMKF